MPVVASATLEVTPVLKGAQQTLTQQLTGAASSAGTTAGTAAGSKLGASLAKGIAGGTALVTGAVAGASAAMIGAAGKTAEYGDQIDKASQKLGVSSTFYQEWQAVLQHSGTDMDRMSATFKKLATASQDASEDQQAAFERLGLSMDDVKNMSTEELFTSVITGLQGMEEGTERTSIATELLGKGAMEMGALLNTSAEDTQGMIDKVHELGGVMDEDAVAASARYQDSLQDMTTAFDGIKNSIGADLLPVLADLFDSVGTWLSETDLTPLTDMIGEAVGALGDFISNLDIEAIGETFQNVVTAIGEVLGTFWEAGKTIFDAVKEALDTISSSVEDTGTDWGTVWDGISGAIQTAAEIIGQIIEIIGQAIGWLVKETQTDGTLLNTVWEGIKTTIDTVGGFIQGVLNVIQDILNGDWSQAWQDAGDTVKTVVDGIQKVYEITLKPVIDAIQAAWESIAEPVAKVLGDIGEKVDSIFGGIKDTVESIMSGDSGIEHIVSDTIDQILKDFDFEWSLPELKLPHIVIDEYMDVPVIGQVPAPWGIRVEWYKKAYSNPYLFTDPTVVGNRGFGDGAGGEIVYGHENLMTDITNAVKRGGDRVFSPTINVYTQEGQSNREIANAVIEIMERQYRDRESVFA